jgi:hypothetical protein
MFFDETTTYPLDLTDEAEEGNESSVFTFPPTDEFPESEEQPQPEQNTYVLTQKWEGYILKADVDTFSVRLFDSAGVRKPHQALFPRADLSEDNQALIKEGALLVWMIGLRQVGIRRRRESEIYIRRLPPWTAAEIEEAQTRAGELHGRIGWE